MKAEKRTVGNLHAENPGALLAAVVAPTHSVFRVRRRVEVRERKELRKKYGSDIQEPSDP